MKKYILGLFLLLFAVTPAFAKPQGAIYVNASSNIDLQPDVVEFNVIIKTTDKHSLENASIANKEISVKILHDFNTLLDKEHGDYIKTANYSANPTYHYNNGKQVFDNYEVVNTLMVHTKKITDVGIFIDKALSLGATNIGSINFTLEDYNSYCNDLLAVATKRAKAKAEAVAAASGQSITGIKEIRTSCNANMGRNYPRYFNAKMSLVAAGATEDAVMDNGTPVESGAIKLYASVDADFWAK